jgi:hypothetical protein
VVVFAGWRNTSLLVVVFTGWRNTSLLVVVFAGWRNTSLLVVVFTVTRDYQVAFGDKAMQICFVWAILPCTLPETN